MGLNFGWRANDIRESIWKDDSTLIKPDGTNRAPAAALDAWRSDGDASHLRPSCEGDPQLITFRNLTTDEFELVRSFFREDSEPMVALSRAFLLCFRIAVDFAGKEAQDDATGVKQRLIVRERGLRMLAEPFVAHLERTYPGMVGFYGGLVFNASMPSVAEKKSIIAAVHADAIVGGGVHDGHYGNVSQCGGCVGCPMGMRERWACPDLGKTKPDGLHNPIPGSNEMFDDCPAYYLRTAQMGLPGEHLIEGRTHPGQIVGEMAFEIESGSRNIETVPPKVRELVHLHFSEKRKREENDRKKREKGRR